MNELASVDVSVNEAIIPPSYGKPSGVCAVIGYTKKGEIGVPKFISSPQSFIDNFGGVETDGDFAHLCLIALEEGAKLLVSRLCKYTVSSGLWSQTGAKATANIIANGQTVSSVTTSATSQGVHGNNVSVKVRSAISRITGLVDINVYSGVINEWAYDVNSILTDSDVANLNAIFSLVDFSQPTATPLSETPTIQLTGGVDSEKPTSVDYVGNRTAKTGIFSFDDSTGFEYIAAFGIAQNAVDIALSNYVTERGDCQAILHTTVGINAANILAYRYAQAPYTGLMVDNWRVRATTGGTKVASKVVSTVTATVSESPFYVAALCRKNATGRVWTSVGAPQYSYIPRALGVSQNFMAIGRKAEGDLVVGAGIVPIVQESNGRVRIFGDSTLQQGRGFLKNANVADTIAFITNGVREIYNKYLFEPNNIPTWRLMHNEVRNFMKPIVDGGGIHAYRYNGDQEKNSFAELTVNNIADVNVGKYKVNIEVFPTTVMQHISIQVNLTDNIATVAVAA
jgi:hypothetical protein